MLNIKDLRYLDDKKNHSRRWGTAGKNAGTFLSLIVTYGH